MVALSIAPQDSISGICLALIKRVTKEIKQLKEEIAELNLINPTEAQEDRLQVISKELERLLEQEEMMWRQRSHVS